ncbi:putative mitochondrial carnitine O-acetyltransferase [Grifola frondosa]|uniref:Putative mitochondrial carnitine O-acetyltransferase n=1 Tax=Grifola frondosa TaxID=5627 RepID=A0A1C7M0Z3_GRIFR|nr:putative mitochondrial carnitine O-acetyltransferase [Grifola frondosa]
MAASSPVTKFESNPPESRTFARQHELPKLPIPSLEDSCRRYLTSLEGLQDHKEHSETRRAVEDFLKGEGPMMQERLKTYAQDKASYIEEFWYESYLSHSDPVVLALNPFFVLENDPTPDRGSQLPRAASLIVSSLGFIHDLRAGMLEPDAVRGIPLDMDQYTRLFGTARTPTEVSSLNSVVPVRSMVQARMSMHRARRDVGRADLRALGLVLGFLPTSTQHNTGAHPFLDILNILFEQRGCKMDVHPDSRHVVILRRGQFYWFDVLDMDNRPVLTEREILRNLQAIISDADQLPVHEVARNSIGVLSTENRKVWSSLRKALSSNKNNESCLEVIDNALFVVCLDDTSPENLAELCDNFLCGTYNLKGGVQVGTCTNRWYDKLQIIVCADGSAGINFEHTGVDGHTVLRFAADIFTEGLMLLARSINPSAPTLFHAPLSPHAKMHKAPARGGTATPTPLYVIDTAPKKLEWALYPELRAGIRFAETRLSDLICQNDCQALEFKGYGKNFITSHGFSPDAFVQMAFQAAYYGLYEFIVDRSYRMHLRAGDDEVVLAWKNGGYTDRAAAQRRVCQGTYPLRHATYPANSSTSDIFSSPQTFFSEAAPAQKVAALRKACQGHVKLTKDCSRALGQDRHLYALYCLMQRDREREALTNGRSADSGDELDGRPLSPSSSLSSGSAYYNRPPLPAIFTDPGWSTLNTSILSTSNCGNPALRLFGFGPVAADGYGIGYIIKDEGISVCASSRHLQTRRFLDTLKGYLIDVQRILIQLHLSANQRPEPFVDHAGVLRDSKTGRPINGRGTEKTYDDEDMMPGYSFFDSGDVELLGRRKRMPSYYNTGKIIPLAEY